MKALVLIFCAMCMVVILVFALTLLELIWTMPAWFVERVCISNQYRERRKAMIKTMKSLGGS